MPLSSAQHTAIQEIILHLDKNESTDSDSLISVALEILTRESPSWLVIARSKGGGSHLIAQDGEDARLCGEVLDWLHESYDRTVRQRVRKLEAELAELRAKIAATQTIA